MKICLKNNVKILKSQQKFRSELCNVFAEKFNKMALSSNDDKKLQTFDGITLYLYGKVCETELLEYLTIDITLIFVQEKTQ